VEVFIIAEVAEEELMDMDLQVGQVELMEVEVEEMVQEEMLDRLELLEPLTQAVAVEELDQTQLAMEEAIGDLEVLEYV
jgi:uncharacterized protein YqgQ